MDPREQVQAAVRAGELSAAAAHNITQWFEAPKYTSYREELLALVTQKQWKLLEDSFFKVVPFGTGGRRGTVGLGSNRINRVTLGESAQGLVNYLLKTVGEPARAQGIVVAFDTRLTSHEFAQFVASVFAANHVTTYLFPSFRATPQLSFAVRHLKAAAGVVISASHNPPSDNGFKAYWSDGGQIVPPHDAGIMAEVEQVAVINEIPYDDAVRDGAITLVGDEVDHAYVVAVRAESVIDLRSATLVYSPLHGTGSVSVQPVLLAAGFSPALVAEQTQPDGHFPTIPNHIPNPEIPAADEIAVAYAQQTSADLAITTDPDADRLGVVARDASGEYHFLTGNQIAALIGYFVAEQLHKQTSNLDNYFMVKTIVTTDLLDAIAHDFGITMYNDILIGFKYVAELIHRYQDEGTQQFLFGGEESHGILKGTYTRDKDAAVAALLIAEQASYLKEQGATLVSQLQELYRRYGLFWETLRNIMYEGAEGFDRMTAIMAGLRENPPNILANQKVVGVVDRLRSQQNQKGDVLVFHLSPDTHSRVTIRPSGTEAKLKVYTQLFAPVDASITDEALERKKKELDQLAKNITDSLIAYTEKINPSGETPHI